MLIKAAYFRNNNNWSVAIEDGYKAIKDVGNRTSGIIKEERDNMTSMFEEKFNYEQHLRDLEISAEQKARDMAQDLALEQLIKSMIDFNIPVTEALKHGYTQEQIDAVLQKLNNDKK